MKKAPVHAIYKRYDAFFIIHIARSRAFAGMKWKFFGVRKRRERTFVHNLCPLCGRRRGAASADRVGRDPCVPPRSTHCSRRGTRAPPYRVRRSHTGRTGSSAPTRFVRDVGDAVPYTPCHCELVRAAKQVPLGYRLARQSVSQRSPPLDKSGGMGIIINRRGRCIRRSVPVSLKPYLDLNDPQKPSPCPVAVFAFQSLDSYRDRMTQNMNRKHEKHTVTPPSKGGNRPPFYVYSVLGTSIHRRQFFVKYRRDAWVPPYGETDSHDSVSTGSE